MGLSFWHTGEPGWTGLKSILLVCQPSYILTNTLSETRKTKECAGKKLSISTPCQMKRV